MTAWACLTELVAFLSKGKIIFRTNDQDHSLYTNLKTVSHKIKVNLEIKDDLSHTHTTENGSEARFCLLIYVTTMWSNAKIHPNFREISNF